MRPADDLRGVEGHLVSVVELAPVQTRHAVRVNCHDRREGMVKLDLTAPGGRTVSQSREQRGSRGEASRGHASNSESACDSCRSV